MYTSTGLGFSEINPREKEINSLTQTVFYSSELMSRQVPSVLRLPWSTAPVTHTYMLSWLGMSVE